MVQSVDQALVTEFSGMVHHEAQQMVSRMRPYAKIKEMSGDVFAYDGLGTVEATEVEGRVNKANFDDLQHNRRKISRRRFVVNLPVDSSDVRGALQDPDSEYAKTVAAALQRQWDRVIQDAAFANVLTGRDFETPVTFANDGGLTVDATAGMTYEKMLEIAQNFIDNEVDFDRGAFLQHTGDEHTSLMGEIELISGDFTRDFNVEDGRIKRALGFDLLAFGANVANPIIPVSGAQRKLIAATKDAFCIGLSKDISIKITERDDYIETHQVQAIMEIGAVRTEGKLVQQVTVTE